MDTPLSKEEFTQILNTTLEARFDDFALMVGKGFANMATKKDLENFATKDDLRDFATKKDIEHFATKEDLGLLRADMGKMEHRLMDKIEDTKNEIKINTATLLRNKEIITKSEAVQYIKNDV